MLTRIIGYDTLAVPFLLIPINIVAPHGGILQKGKLSEVEDGPQSKTIFNE